MIKLQWKMNGRTIRPAQISNELMKSARQIVTSRIEDAVEGVSCPVHGRRPSNVRRVSSSDGKMKFEFQACCEELKAAVARSLR